MGQVRAVAARADAVLESEGLQAGDPQRGQTGAGGPPTAVGTAWALEVNLFSKPALPLTS